MKIVIWVLSVVAAIAFAGMGLIKLTMPAGELAAMSQGVPVELLRLAGLAEFLGGLGLVLPAATRILPGLTPLAAAGLVVTWSAQSSPTSFSAATPRSSFQPCSPWRPR